MGPGNPIADIADPRFRVDPDASDEIATRDFFHREDQPVLSTRGLDIGAAICFAERMRNCRRPAGDLFVASEFDQGFQVAIIQRVKPQLRTGEG